MEQRRESHKNILWGGLCIYRKGWLVDEKPKISRTETGMCDLRDTLTLSKNIKKAVLRKLLICGFIPTKAPFSHSLTTGDIFLRFFFFFCHEGVVRQHLTEKCLCLHRSPVTDVEEFVLRISQDSFGNTCVALSSQSTQNLSCE
jgi:hypothetical protein